MVEELKSLNGNGSGGELEDWEDINNLLITL